MSELEQKKLEAVLSLVYSPDSPWGYSDAMELAEKITKVFSQFDEPKNIIETTYATGEIIRYQPCEPLEVEIEEMLGCFYIVYWSNLASYYGKVYLRIFQVKQEAIDFCKRHGLKIKS